MTYVKRYQQLIIAPETFWAQAAQSLQWQKSWQAVLSGNLRDGNVHWCDEGA